MGGGWGSSQREPPPSFAEGTRPRRFPRGPSGACEEDTPLSVAPLGVSRPKWPKRPWASRDHGMRGCSHGVASRSQIELAEVVRGGRERVVGGELAAVAPRRRPGASVWPSRCTRVGERIGAGRLQEHPFTTRTVPGGGEVAGRQSGRPARGPRLCGHGVLPIEKEVFPSPPPHPTPPRGRGGGRVRPVGTRPPSVVAGCAAEGRGGAMGRPRASQFAPRSAAAPGRWGPPALCPRVHGSLPHALARGGVGGGRCLGDGGVGGGVV